MPTQHHVVRDGPETSGALPRAAAPARAPLPPVFPLRCFPPLARSRGQRRRLPPPCPLPTPAALSRAQEYVFIKRVVGAEPVEGEVYAKLSGVAKCADVGDLAAHACDRFKRWAVDADQLRLHLVKHPLGGDEPTEAAETAAVAAPRLQSGWTLASAGIKTGAWLLARVPPPAAAAAPAGALCGARAGSPPPLALVCAYSCRCQRACSPLPFACAQAALGRRWEQVGSASPRRSRL